LYYLNLGHNRLNGSLARLGQELASPSAVNSITTLDLSSNQLSGEIPASLQRLALFSTNSLARSTVGGRYSATHPPPVLLDLSGNRLSSAFPAFLLELLPAVSQECSARGCSARAALSGPDMELRCPPRQRDPRHYTAEQLELLRPMQLECVTDQRERVNVVAWLAEGDGGTPSAAGTPSTSDGSPAAVTDSVSPDPEVAQDAEGGSSSASGGAALVGSGAGAPVPGKLSGGSIAGLAIGLTSGLALLAVLVYMVGYRRLHWLSHRSGGSPMRPVARIAAGASAYLTARHVPAFGSRVPLPKASDDDIAEESRERRPRDDGKVLFIFNSAYDHQADSRAAFV
jgi:hypothetical protein